MNLRAGKIRFARLFIFCGLLMLVSVSCGCEVLVRKFTRKPKEAAKEEPVVDPQNYPDFIMTKEALYRDYFLFWETWVDELISFLEEGANSKKQKECAREALDNLTKCMSLLNEEKARQLNVFVLNFSEVKNRILAGNMRGMDFSLVRRRVENIKSGVHRGFTFPKINKDLK